MKHDNGVDVLADATTNAAGKIELEAIRPGSFIIFGSGVGEDGYYVWMQKVEIAPQGGGGRRVEEQQGRLSPPLTMPSRAL